MNELIALSHCMSHDVKAMRNNLWRSVLGRTKAFERNGHSFGWDTKKETFEKDLERDTKETKMSLASTNVDKWSKMSVKHAKDPLDCDTITEQMQHLAGLLRCTHLLVNEGKGKSVSNFHLDRLELLRSYLKPDSPAEHHSNFLELKHSVNVSLTFNEFFLNSTKRITLENVDSCERSMKGHLDCFYKWKQDTLKLKNDGQSNWENTFTSITTWKILRISMCRFFKHARLMLSDPDSPKHVPLLHGNWQRSEIMQ